MKLFCLPNLEEIKVSEVEFPLNELPQNTPYPKELTTKAEYRLWCNRKTTDHVFYNAVEGRTPGLRVSGSNPPWKIHGLIGEFDAQPPEGWLEMAKNAKLPPTWVSRSFSNNVRMVWAFEKPIGATNTDFVKAFYQAAWKQIKPIDVGYGYREEESTRPSQYFELGHNWALIGGTIPSPVVEGWGAQAVQKVNWEREAVTIPFEALRAEGEKQFPGRWPGGWDEFEKGARGVRFWEPGADAESVIVTETGCVCFTGDHPFMKWADIFGKAFVEAASNEAMGRAVEGLWWEPDKATFWKKHGDGAKHPLKRREDLILHLTKHGLSRTVPKGMDHSQVDDAIYKLQNHRILSGVFPAMYHPEDTICINGGCYLNTSMLRLTTPIDGKVAWGEGFPVTAEFLEKVFLDGQLDYFLGWLAHFYRSCLKGKPERGLAMFIAGAQGVGKSFLSFGILGQLFGSHEDASHFLTGQDKFNDRLVGSPLWTIDDATAATDPQSRNRYSQLIKMAVANDHIHCRGMYKSGFTVPWRGRIVVTMNADSESARMIPNLELSIQDKVMLLKGYVPENFSWALSHDGKYPEDHEVAPELPFLGAYLRDMQVAKHVWAGGRFSIKHFHHPELLELADDASDTAGAQDVLDLWRQQYFELNPDKDIWVGSAARLHEQVLQCLDQVGRMQFKSSNSMGMYVSKFIARGVKWIRRVKSNGHKLIEVSKTGSTRVDGCENDQKTGSTRVDP